MADPSADIEPRFDRRLAAFTLIELLVAILILGVLMALLLPAVHSARATARRIQCVNHLKQIALALHQYESRHHVFPAIYSDGQEGSAAYAYSPLTRVLADLEQVPLANSANLVLGHSEPESLIGNFTVASTAVAIFVCPADQVPPVSGYGRVNYRFNVGPIPWISPNYLTRPDHLSGPFTMHVFYRAAQFPDGLANTVGISERIQGDWTKDVKGAGDYRLANYGIGIIDDFGRGQHAIERCVEAASGFPLESRGGESWFYSGFHFTNYNHCVTPNPGFDDCSFDDAREGVHNRTIHSGSFPARSYHPGGVNAALMDGSVRFVKDGVSLAIWQAVSTRNGGEAVSADSY